jgi:hypothetical protein
VSLLLFLLIDVVDCGKVLLLSLLQRLMPLWFCGWCC